MTYPTYAVVVNVKEEVSIIWLIRTYHPLVPLLAVDHFIRQMHVNHIKGTLQSGGEFVVQLWGYESYQNLISFVEALTKEIPFYIKLDAQYPAVYH